MISRAIPAIIGLAIGLSFATVVLAQSRSVPPDTADDSAAYRQCLSAVNKNAETGFEHAIGWASLGGGDPARHCVAVALLRLGQYNEAARRLDELARDINAGPEIKADILGQAGQAWLLAGDNAAAEATLTAAINLDAGDSELFVDRAQVRAASNNLPGAIDDLTAAIRLDANAVDARVFRASALRQTNQQSRAINDVEAALALDPTHPEGLLERGILRRAAGDVLGARRDWVRVIEIAPTSPAATAAGRNIELMDGPARQPLQPAEN